MLRTESSPNDHRQLQGRYRRSMRVGGSSPIIKCLHKYRTDRRALATSGLLLLCVTACIRSSSAASIAAPPIHTKPYRVLLVVEHWSYVRPPRLEGHKKRALPQQRGRYVYRCQ